MTSAAGSSPAGSGADSALTSSLYACGEREFAAEFALLGQAVTGALATADSPDACDEQLADGGQQHTVLAET
ncbi:hypothetical protein AB0P40_27900, partial [Streptomyces sp. NPDC079189]|uniref:hypothetical protein n=1 Tax=Streptomyces sp. NPDC079189 TaxID=3154514 RepID=UPI00344495CF